MNDAIVRAGNSQLQHGAYNDRIYLMKLAEDDYPGILDDLEKLALDQGYGKIVAKIPDWARSGFLQMGYQQEAAVPGLFNGVADGYFVSKFLSDSRAREKDPEGAAAVIHTASVRCREREDEVKMPERSFHCRICKDTDVSQMAQVYQTVFETYPFPVHDPEYIAKTMLHNFVYLGIWHDEKLVALSAIEIDLQSANGEMTDFATLPAYRGRGLSHFLLYQAEQVVGGKDIRTVYTIARATSFGMNITFAKRGYIYTGRLVNNTNISGSFESMNVWYKPL
ncbi:putative beta-lysine N-acetyltransferase [Acetonema longum]|uniref:GCN5-related N-acetyltransferase n=1 Tax=Acetonema longum DSM 6540 TaxID=1009370 RepID=F7NG92_9FIRM|nr:putative beta-lysine N-acetyltransferase [Acetonema longum]EGO65010.1 GCN5-related N-acetyltransferase [Acetonema longum DSM 6540]